MAPDGRTGDLNISNFTITLIGPNLSDMKKMLLSIATLVLVVIQSSAQLNYNAYLTQNFSGTYTDLGTNGSIASTINKDDAVSTNQNIGFVFRYNGQNYTQFRLSTNGFIKLGNGAPSSTALFYATGNTTTGGVFNSTNNSDINLIVPFNHDLIGAGPTAEYRVYTAGAVGSRVCTIQFKNLRDKTTFPYPQFDSINFQIKLYETSNVIDFVYGKWTASSDSSRYKSAACGLKGDVGVTTNQLVVVSKGSTQTYDNIGTTFLNGNYPGNAFNFGNSNPGDGAGPGGSRPMVDIGRTYRFTPAYLQDIAVGLVIAQGELAVPWGLPHAYKASISNVGLNTMTNFYVRMDITGANTYKDSVLVSSLAVGASLVVNFGTYYPPNMGLNDIYVHVPADNNNANNGVHYRQEVTRDKFSHVDTTKALLGNIGYPVGAAGFILHRYHITGKRRIVQTGLFISNEAANVGNTIYGAVFNAAGTLLARSENYVIQANDLGTWKNFDIDVHPVATTTKIRPPLISNADFYAGIAATAGTVRFNPIGHIAESPLRPNTFYSLPGLTGGSAPTPYSTSLEYRSYMRAVARGNSLRLENKPIADPSCPTSAGLARVTIKNYDSIAVDFSVDTLFLSISSTGAVTQSFQSVISSGILEPDSSASFTITNSFDLSVQGTYNIEVSGITKLDVDTANNYKKYNAEVVITPAATITVFPKAVLCDSIPFTFRAVPYTAGSKSYQWKVNGLPVGPVTSDSTFTPSNLVWGDKVSVDLITDHCTTSVFTVTSNEIEMQINPKPKPISGTFATDTVVQLTNKNYAIAIQPKSTYLWKVQGGTISGDSTKSAIAVNWGVANANASISVVEKDSTNCVRKNTRPVVIIDITGIEGVDQGLILGEIYPNPANSEVIIPVYSEHAGNLSISLFDLSGKKVKSSRERIVERNSNVLLPVGDLTNGIYLIEMKTDEGYNLIRKLSIIH